MFPLDIGVVDIKKKIFGSVLCIFFFIMTLLFSFQLIYIVFFVIYILLLFILKSPVRRPPSASSLYRVPLQR